MQGAIRVLQFIHNSKEHLTSIRVVGAECILFSLFIGRVEIGDKKIRAHCMFFTSKAAFSWSVLRQLARRRLLSKKEECFLILSWCCLSWKIEKWICRTTGGRSSRHTPIARAGSLDVAVVVNPSSRYTVWVKTRRRMTFWSRVGSPYGCSSESHP